MSTDDPVAFIVARLDEDEATALAALSGAEDDGQWRTEGPGWGDGCRVYGHGMVLYDEGGHTDAQAIHIVRHDPARVLAEARGTRLILDEVRAWRHDYCDGDPWYSCAQAERPTYGDDEPEGPGSGCSDETRRGDPCDCGLTDRRQRILYLLTLPYADHPDYQKEWAA